MPQLLGPDGQPIRRQLLKREIAAPTVTGVRPIIGDHPSAGLTPRRLANLLRSAEEGDAIAYLELAEDMEEKDLHYSSVMGTRKRAVAQLEVTVRAASDAADDEADAELIRQFLARDEIEDEVFDMLDAIGKGYSVTEIIWEETEGQWMPERLEWRLPQWFELDRDDGRTIWLRGDDGPEALPPWKFIVHCARAKSGLPIRGGLARIAAWAYLFKNYTLKDWVQFAEVYGQPIRVGKYHPGATEDERATLLRAVASIGTDAAAIIPESMLIEFVKADQTGSMDLYERLCDWLDRQMSKAVLGQTLTTEVKSGSLAAARVHEEVRADIERADARQLAATLNRWLVRPIIDLNRGPRRWYPSLSIGRAEEHDINAMSEAIARLVPMGLRVRQAQVREMLGLDDPDAEDELLGGGSEPSPTEPDETADKSDDEEGDDQRETASACPIHGGRPALAAADAQADPDSIEDLVAEMLDVEGWEEDVDPIVDPVRRLLDDSDTLEEVRDRLAELLAGMSTDQLADRLARAAFASRLAGEVEAPIADDRPERG